MNKESIQDLMRAAQAARENAYAPYSGYTVGAAILADSGKVYAGANVENAAYPSGLCAERVALFAAVAAGERIFRALAVVTRDGGPPCGACRQALAEFDLTLKILCADENGRIVRRTDLAHLLPDPFGAGHLNRK